MLHRTNVVAKPIDGFNACDDFFNLVIEALVVVAAMKKFGMSSLQGVPSELWVRVSACMQRRRNSGSFEVINFIAHVQIATMRKEHIYLLKDHVLKVV